MVHVQFDTSSVSLNDFIQIGSGGEINYFKGLPPYQRGYGYRQRGAGIGAILRSLWRTLLPALKSAGSTVGKEALFTGSRILDKIAQGENVKESVLSEGRAGVGNLLEKGGFPAQSGKGIKRKQIHGSPIIISNNKGSSAVKLIGKSVPKKLIRKRKRSDAFGFY